MSTWAKPGAKCVCVAPIESLVKGQIYTIEEILERDSSGRLGVVLVECRSAITWTNTRGGFRLSRFRPIARKSQEQDIALFRQILADLPIGEDA